MSGKKWLTIFVGLLAAAMLTIASLITAIDPYFHFHKPRPELFYELYNQRIQNDGIIRNFDYDGLLTGTSMTENFRASEAGEIFGGEFIKVPFAGAYFGEINDRLDTALRCRPGLKYVIRGLDINFFNIDKDDERSDLGSYPEYLYDDCLFNDAYYVFSKEPLVRSLIMLWDAAGGARGGITDFDLYSRWADGHELGAAQTLSGISAFPPPEHEEKISAADEQRIRENIRQNVTALPARYPDTEFYYFITPYSAASWGKWMSEGRLEYMLETERIAIDEILSADCENLRLFSWDDRADICLRLDNYKDPSHYGEHINSLILRMMKDGEGLITRESFPDYMERLENQYINFDFNTLFDQLG